MSSDKRLKRGKKMNCPICKNKLLTASRYIDDFDVDEEPYESGKKEEGEIMQGNFTTPTEVCIVIQFCEHCDKIITVYAGD